MTDCWGRNMITKSYHTTRSSPLLHLGVLAILFNLALGATMTSAWSQNARSVKIVAFGDSLTAGFNLAPSQAFPAVLQRALAARGVKVEVMNAGVSGDTTAAGLERFDWAIPDGTDAVILELGANDALRGIPPAEVRANLDKILSRLRQRGIEVLVTGMVAPRNWGDEYAAEYDRIFPELAQKHGATLYPFFLDGVALKPELNLSDGMHPNGKGVEEIVKRILPMVEELSARAGKRSGAGKS